MTKTMTIQSQSAKSKAEARDIGAYLLHLIDTYPDINEETIIKYLDEYFELMGYGKGTN